MQFYVYVCLYRCTGLWVHMHEEASTGCQMSFSVALLILLRQGLSLKQKLSSVTGQNCQPASLRELRSLPYRADYRGTPKPPFFMWVLRIEIRKVNSKPFTETSPQTPCNVFIRAHVHLSQVSLIIASDISHLYMATIFKVLFRAWAYCFSNVKFMQRYSPDLIRCIIKFENAQKLSHFRSSNAEIKCSVYQIM